MTMQTKGLTQKN